MAAGSLTVTIETLAPGDLVSVARCIAIDAEAFPYASTQFGVRAANARVWIAHIAHSGGSDRIFGFAAGRPSRGELDIEGVAVVRDARRRGIGSALLREAVAYARSRSMEAVSLHVWTGNDAAVAMYEAEGFAIRRRLPGYYRAGTFDNQGDAYEMAFPLER